MTTQSTEQKPMTSLLDEIFIAPSNRTQTERFSSEVAAAPCRESCSGDCHSLC